MKIIGLVYLFWLGMLSVCFCQKPNITWGKEEKHPFKTYLKKIICEHQGQLYTYRTSGESLKRNEHFLEVYNSQHMHLLERFSLKGIYDGDALVEDIKYIGEKLVVFYSVLDRENVRTAYAQVINFDGKTTGAAIELDKLTFSKRKNIGVFDFVVSEDSTKLLLYRNEPFDKYANEKFTYVVLDKTLKTLWRKEIELPYTDRYFEITEYRIDNNGNVFMLGAVYPDKTKGEKSTTRFVQPKYIVFSYHYAENELSEYEIQLENKYISDITFRLNDKNDLVVGGFYATTPGSGIQGTFFMRIDDESREVTSTNLKAFDKDFMRNFLSERRVEKGRGLTDMYFDYFILRSNGGAVLVGEQYYAQHICYQDFRTGNMICTYHFYYNDIIVVNIDELGNITWTRRIPKLQHTVNDNGFYSSYSLGVIGKKLQFIYNDHPKNIQPTQSQATDKIRVMSGASAAVTVLVSIDENGNMVKQPLFSARGGNVIARPKIFKQISPNQLVVFAQRGRKYSLGKLVFD